MNERDLIGYGPNPPQIEWPNGARIAISVVVNYEEGSEYSLLDGDPHHETETFEVTGLPGGPMTMTNRWVRTPVLGDVTGR